MERMHWIVRIPEDANTDDPREDHLQQFESFLPQV